MRKKFRKVSKLLLPSGRAEKQAKRNIPTYYITPMPNNMSSIKSKNTGIEVAFRKALWKAGFRYRKNYKKLPGKPDIALTKQKIAIFCDGEFWHGKNWDVSKEKIKSNRNYWIPKIDKNIKRDFEADRDLKLMGWEVLHFWGTDIERDMASCIEQVKEAIFYRDIELEP